jgi:hypothetical protein
MTAQEEHRLVARVTSLEADLGKALALLAAGVSDPEDERRGKAVSDVAWKCKKCGTLLGFYDVESDVLRLRYKEDVCYVRVGEGGFIQKICRGCGEINTQSFVTPEEVARAATVEPRVTRRRVPG